MTPYHRNAYIFFLATVGDIYKSHFCSYSINTDKYW